MGHPFDSSPTSHTPKTSSPRTVYGDRNHANSPSYSSHRTSASMYSYPSHPSPSRYKQESSDASTIKADAPPTDHQPSSSASTSKPTAAKAENKDDKKSTAKRPREQYSCVECCKCPHQLKQGSIVDEETHSLTSPLTFDRQSDESKSAIDDSHAIIASSVVFQNDAFHLRPHAPIPSHPPLPIAAPSSIATASLAPHPTSSSAPASVPTHRQQNDNG